MLLSASWQMKWAENLFHVQGAWLQCGQGHGAALQRPFSGVCPVLWCILIFEESWFLRSLLTSLVFRASNVKLLSGWSRLPALSVQFRGCSRWPQASVVFIAGAPRKCAFLPPGQLDLESAVTAQNDESKGSFHSYHSSLLNVKM